MSQFRVHRLLLSAASAHALVLSFGAVGLTAVPSASAAPAAVCEAGTPVAGDYDGDGGADLAVSVERAVAGEHDTPFTVIPSDTLARYWVGEGATNGELVNADLNGDTCADAVVGGTTLVFGSHDGLGRAGTATLDLPQASLPGPEERLEVTATALRHDGISQVAVAGWTYDAEEGCCEAHQFLDVFTLDASGTPGTPRVFDLTARGADGNLSVASSGRTIAVGNGELKVSGKILAGGVYMFSSSAADPVTMTYRTTLTQNSPGIPGHAESGDFFGGSISFRDGRLAIGASGESIGKAVATGQVQPLLWKESTSTWTAYRAINQDTPGVVGTNESGDQFGYEVLVTRGLTASGSYDIAISATETVGKASAGSVTVANFSRPLYRTLTQDTKGVPGTAETADDFGAALGVLRTSPSRDTLLIGVPGEKRQLPSPPVGFAMRSDGKKMSASTHWSSVPGFEDGNGTTYEAWGRAFAR
ncbi:MAG: hypothetical protein LCH96_18415 [Actinobacteria bacterium]|nr:hypothetical protein [Actinomycetota bacterium]